jgi:hypothetical protein
MQDEWILDVLGDLKSFARANGMPALAAQLDDAMFVAHAEKAYRAEGNGVATQGPRAETGTVDRTLGVCEGPR